MEMASLLSRSQSMGVLQGRTAVNGAGQDTIEIHVYDADAGEAATLANAIAEAALDHRDADQPMVRIVAKAMPRLKPAWPNKPAELLYGATIGALLGSIAGICAVGLRRWRRSRS